MSRFSLIYIGSFCLLLSALSFFNIIYSYYFDLSSSANNYFITLIVSLFCGLVFLFKKRDEEKISIFNKIQIVIFGYLFIPLIISIPYLLGNYNLTFINCYFESISGFTSTGFTILENLKHFDESIILWRSSSQWIGGLYFLFSLILLIDIFDNNLKKSITNFLSFNSSETFKQSFKVTILYSLLTFIIFLVLKILNIRDFDAFNFSLTLISSGGFSSINNPEFLIKSNFSKIVLSFTMLLSFFSIFLFYNIIFIKKKSLNVFSEDFYLLVYLILLIIIFFIFFNFSNEFGSVMLSITTSISNIGISFSDNRGDLSFLYLILVIIGGSFFSTSSGLRFIKIFTLFKFSLNELLSYSKPKQILISKITFAEKNIDRKDIDKYFLTLFIFIISLLSFTILCTMTGVNFVESFKLGILTLMNTVNSNIYGLENFDFDKIGYFSKIIFIVFMIIGRVELVTFLILIKKYLLKN